MMKKTATPYRFVYAGMLAYCLTSCATSYIPRLQTKQDATQSQTTDQYLTKEQEEVQVVLRYEGVANNMMGFSMEVTNYGQKPIEIDPVRFYAMGYTANRLAYPTPMYAFNPEEKIAEMDRRIHNRINGGGAGRTILIILGVILIVGIVAVALSESANNKTETKSGRQDAPRNSNMSYSNNTYSRQGACYNRPTNHDDNTLITTLQFIGRTVEMTATGAMRSKINQDNAVENLTYIRNIWENETIRKVTLHTNERLRGTVFFPNISADIRVLRLNFPITQYEHQFAFNQY